MALGLPGGLFETGFKVTISDNVLVKQTQWEDGNCYVSNEIGFIVPQNVCLNYPLESFPCYFSGSVRIKTAVWKCYYRSSATASIFAIVTRNGVEINRTSTVTVSYDIHGTYNPVDAVWDIYNIEPGDVIHLCGYTNFTNAEGSSACYSMTICGTITN